MDMTTKVGRRAGLAVLFSVVPTDPSKAESLDARFGVALRRLRDLRKLSQEDLAEAIGYNRTTIGLWERGRKSPTLAAVAALSAALGVSASELLRLAEHVEQEGA